MNDYPPIADHGLVGDLQTAALIAADGTVDWWCTPRFDSPSVFASLLDSDRGGYCRLAADLGAADEAGVRQLYLTDTAVLVTRFMAPGGVGEVLDFMEPDPSNTPSARHRLIRVARVVRGSLPFELLCRPRFDYGRASHTLRHLDDGSVVFHGPDTDLHVQATAPIALHPDGHDVSARFTLDAGELAAVVLTSESGDAAARGGRPGGPPPTVQAITAAFDACRAFWLTWLRASRYRGRWQEMVTRSAITLKLLTYAPTGAPIAAATMGLPEQIGGERNWDYRYTWIRDASLSVHALTTLGFTRDANAYRRWLRERLDAGWTASGEPLQIMYRVDG
ncbi:glycoside hydrolase family 15 protein, partial [Frankia sp. CpI1-P]